MREEDRQMNDNAEQEKKPKKNGNHTGLKIFMPLLAGIYGTAISIIAGIFVMFNESWKNELKTNAVEIVLIGVTFFIAVRLLPKCFPQVKNYSFKKPEWRVIAAVVLCTPLYIVIRYGLIYLGACIFSAPQMELMTYNAEELITDLVASLSAIVLAPIYEELSFRYIPITIYKKKWARILVGIIMACMFSWLHGRNWIAVLVDALVYCTLFLVTGNIWTNICAHSCNNLFATIMAVLTFYGAKVKMSEGSPLVLLFPWKIVVVCVALALAGVVIFAVGKRKTEDKNMV